MLKISCRAPFCRLHSLTMFFEAIPPKYTACISFEKICTYSQEMLTDGSCCGTSSPNDQWLFGKHMEDQFSVSVAGVQRRRISSRTLVVLPNADDHGG